MCVLRFQQRDIAPTSHAYGPSPLILAAVRPSAAALIPSGDDPSDDLRFDPEPVKTNARERGERVCDIRNNALKEKVQNEWTWMDATYLGLVDFSCAHKCKTND
jgi:hypothetical protein